MSYYIIIMSLFVCFWSGFIILYFLGWYIAFTYWSLSDCGKTAKAGKTARAVKLCKSVVEIPYSEQEILVNWASTKNNNVVTRNLTESCSDLHNFDTNPLNTIRPKHKTSYRCYGCSKGYKSPHPVYLFSCFKCGTKYQRFRNLKRDLSGHVAVVVGARTKLGHQIVVKLLEAGCYVYGTTRFPSEALNIMRTYDKWEDNWKNKITFTELDLDCDNVDEKVINLTKSITHGKVDILINCAAQTIQKREKEKNFSADVVNRYNEDRYANSAKENSWDMGLFDVSQKELEEVHRINAVAMLVVVRNFVPLMNKSDVQTGPYIINVHAREGIFNVKKGDKHIHTNMAKASFSMLTKCLGGMKMKTEAGMPFRVHGCDPGWISVDEYYETKRPWVVAPIDERDGAARILYPVFSKLKTCLKTRRHFYKLTY